MPALPAEVAVIGSGAWGEAFGRAIAAADCPVVFWDREFLRAEKAADRRYCRAAADWEDAAAHAEILIVAVNSAGFADILQRLVGDSRPIIWLTKGMVPQSGEPLYAVAARMLGDDACYGVISGPSFAVEVNRGQPAALTLALRPLTDGERLRTRLHRPHLRFYLEDDIIGVCIGGAVKNIIAIAAGISNGLGLGESARAALITRGLAEMGALTAALGGRPDTLLGLSGVGDLTLTCCSPLSRNFRLGLVLAGVGEVGQGKTMEGKAAAAAVAACGRRLQLELPIISAVAAVLAGECTPTAAAAALLARPPR